MGQKKGWKPKKRDHLFQKGKVYNPGGRPKLDQDVVVVQRLTHKDLVEQASQLWFAPVDELLKIVADSLKSPEKGGGQVPTGRAMLASVMLHTIRKGDPSKLNAILDRMVGRAAETIKLMGTFEGTNQSAIPVQQIYGDPEMAEKAYHLANFVADKMIDANPNKVTDAQFREIKANKEDPDDEKDA